LGLGAFNFTLGLNLANKRERMRWGRKGEETAIDKANRTTRLEMSVLKGVKKKSRRVESRLNHKPRDGRAIGKRFTSSIP